VNPADLHVFADEQVLDRAVSGRLETIIRDGVASGRDVNLVLSGGRTPAGVYRALAEIFRRKETGLDRVRFFFGDERCVPPDHEASNYRLAVSTLLNSVPVSMDRIHRIHGELGAVEGARDYESTLKELLRAREEPWFDIVLLGVGSDGHTASIFPVQSTRTEYLLRRVVPVTDAPPPVLERITLTPRALNSARFVFFLVKGPEKSAVLRQLVSGRDRGPHFPASLIRPTEGRLEIFADKSAASGLEF